MREERIGFSVEPTAVRVSTILLEPENPRFLYVLAHGAGAGMQHPFLETLARLLADKRIGTFRFQFPYMECGRKRPDPPHLLQATVRSAIEAARARRRGVPLVAGGKSMGGRMTSSAAAGASLTGVAGLVFLGFPLHASGKPGVRRADHLDDVDLPMLFLQGTRDSLADLDLFRPACERIGERATLHVVEGGDHSFGVLKRSGRTTDEVMEELATAISDWGNEILGGSAA